MFLQDYNKLKIPHFFFERDILKEKFSVFLKNDEQSFILTKWSKKHELKTSVYGKNLYFLIISFNEPPGNLFFKFVSSV
jgi:hypothetical protein